MLSEATAYSSEGGVIAHQITVIHLAHVGKVHY